MPRSGATNEEAILARHGFTLGAELGEGTYSKVKHVSLSPTLFMEMFVIFNA